jgi:hypothetical protein
MRLLHVSSLLTLFSSFKWTDTHISSSKARTVSVNTQIHTHQDKKNALLFDSVYFFGNHSGGEFLLPSLGVAYTGLQGYSFHGPFRILYHGVAQYYFKKGLPDPPFRFSVAMWSRESSFTSIARHSAYYKKANTVCLMLLIDWVQHDVYLLSLFHLDLQ